jgi:ribosomal protein S18 acetylase RimI-like enzyme
MDSKQGLYRAQGLSQTALADIKQLMQGCNIYEGLDLKINLNILSSRPHDEINDFLYYEQDVLVGFLGLYSFNPGEGEISGMVHPGSRRKGIFTALFRAALEECRHRNIVHLLLIVEHASSSGQAFIGSLDTTYDHSEYKMVLEEARLPTSFDEHLQFREAREEDIPALTHITALAFDLPEQGVNWYSPQVLANQQHRYYVIALKNVDVIGKLDVSLTEQAGFIYGFGVLPTYRGRGYGRQLLARTIQTLLAQGKTQIALEVATVNKNALSLYLSCGFKETGSYDYYMVSVLTLSADDKQA